MNNWITLLFIWGSYHWSNCSPLELLIFNLAISDLVNSILLPCIAVYDIVTCHCTWHFGWIGCKIIPVMTSVLPDISVGILLIMAIERLVISRLVFPDFWVFTSSNNYGWESSKDKKDYIQHIHELPITNKRLSVILTGSVLPKEALIWLSCMIWNHLTNVYIVIVDV